MITHYQRLLDYIVPDFVHVMNNGSIVKSGGSEIASEIEKNGFSSEIELLAKVLKKTTHYEETPISYKGRTYAEGKKIKFIDA